jgi:hypothetical protein
MCAKDIRRALQKAYLECSELQQPTNATVQYFVYLLVLNDVSNIFVQTLSRLLRFSR